jgi:hypothetical protein
MIVYKTREEAEEAKMTDYQYHVSDMIVKVEDGFAIMPAREYIDWLLNQKVR